MWHVYRGINNTLREIYYGVSKDPENRVDGSHCRGGTKALRHWDCDGDHIEWVVLLEFDVQADASSHAHGLEGRRCPPGYAGYYIIATAGI